MFIRKKNNKSGTVSIQIVDRSRGRYKVVKTLGCSRDPLALDRLTDSANSEMSRLSQPLDINFDPGKGNSTYAIGGDGEEQMNLTGPELIIGKLFDEIGFNLIRDEFFRHLVLTRLCYPVSLLKVVDYLHRSKGVNVEAERVFLYLDRLNDRQKERVQEISGTHARKNLHKAYKRVSCYVTPIAYDLGDQDVLTSSGTVRDGKLHLPHQFLALFVSANGDPLAYEFIEGKKFQDHLLLPLVEAFKAKFHTKTMLVVADTGMFLDEHTIGKQEEIYEFVFGIRLKSEDRRLMQQISALKLKNNQTKEIALNQETRLLVSYSRIQAEKESSNRHRGLEKLERAIGSGRLSRKNINNRGYNRYLKPLGKVGVGIDYRRFKQDDKLDGLKGTLTNAKINKDQVADDLECLCRVGEAFRMSQTDLQAGTSVHQHISRVEAHVSIAFCAYKIYKELERTLKSVGLSASADDAIELAKTISEISVQSPSYEKSEVRLQLQNDGQKELLRLFGIQVDEV